MLEVNISPELQPYAFRFPMHGRDESSYLTGIFVFCACFDLLRSMYLVYLVSWWAKVV